MKTPVAIVGGGPGGSALALYLAKLGVRSAIIEKDEFPRYHIGESMSGEAGNLLRGLGLEPKMAARGYPLKWGLHVFGNAPGDWYVPVKMRTPQHELEEIFTWQVRRSEFDRMLLEEAQGAGAELVRGQAMTPLLNEDGSVRGVRVKMADGGMQDVLSEVLADVSGQAKWLAATGLTSSMEMGHYEKQVKNALPMAGKNRGNTLIFYKRLVHWAWFIPIDDEVVSVGVVSPGSYFKARKESKRDFLLREMQELHPELRRRCPDLGFVEEVRAIQNYSYHIQRFTGKGWMCLGDAHRFIDPIFSFGLFVSLKEAELAAPAIEGYLAGANRDEDDPFAAHGRLCEFGLDKLQDLIDGFWSHPLAFAIVAHQKFPDETIDLFAGRIFGNDVNPALDAMRNLKKAGYRWWEAGANWWDQGQAEQVPGTPAR